MEDVYPQRKYVLGNTTVFKRSFMVRSCIKLLSGLTFRERKCLEKKNFEIKLTSAPPPLSFPSNISCAPMKGKNKLTYLQLAQ